MDGKSHLAAGVIFSGIGLMVANPPLQEVALPLVIGGISGLAPDLDHHNSILTKKVSKYVRWLLSVGVSVFMFYIAYQLYILKFEKEIVFGIVLIGVIASVLFLSFMKSKNLLLISGLILILVGLCLLNTIISVVLLGFFISIASQLKHRGLTHSLYSLLFWSVICLNVQMEIGQNNIWLAGTLGYLSHLLTDDWFTRRRIKWIKTNEVMWLIKKVKRLAN
ncbi:metal-dependent hydrolase [Viridibacillus arvi]|uniref:metal-dependent hydrolase n=1 Tax=Viridibacillus arvi TaxID=263475 RepID=UPI0034CE3C8C